MSYRTTFCIVNFSGKDITRIEFSNVSGFENYSGDLKLLQEHTIAANASLCSYVELSNSGPSAYTLKLIFSDNTYLQFSDDQQQAMVKMVGLIPHQGNAQNLEVWRSSGGNVGSSTHGTNGIYIRSLPQPDNSSWMNELLRRKPDVTLNQLTMPGSHDAGVYTGHTTDYNLGGGGEWAATQRLSILDQLKAGSRYFDMRVCWYGNDLVTYHGESGYGAYGAKLNTILGDVETFLSSAEGMNEVVILRFKRPDIHSVHNSTSDTVAAVKNSPHLYKPASPNSNLATAKLSDLKGRFVAAFDNYYAGLWDRPNGVFPYYEIADSNSTQATGLSVYDNYSNDGTFEQMNADQKPKLNKFGGWGNGYLFLLSWTLSGGGSVSDIEVLAGMANPWLPKKLSELIANHGTEKPHTPNIVYIDFVDPYLCRAIIELNHRTLIRSYASADARFTGNYLGEKPPDGSWQFEQPMFYAYTDNEPGTVPIHRFRATNPSRYYYTTSMNHGNSVGHYEGIAFYAFYPNIPPGAVPINQFYCDIGQTRIYMYSSETKSHDGWILSGVNFYAYPYRG
ncbi:MAG TPA: hypothetical protein VGW12_22630 [Pyrinomonadaceae bacterium]|nr:hypothetical protein [Pyrinomonadaceae bacterium]